MFWVGVIYLILRFETHLVSLRMLKLHHLFVLLGRGKRKMNVFYHVWLVNGGTPTWQKTWNKCHRWESGVPCVKIPAPMSNHGHAATARFTLSTGDFIFKNVILLVASCARSWSNQGILRREIPCAVKVCGIHLQYLIWALNILFSSRN